MIIIDSSTLANQSLATALLCHTYVAKADRQIFLRLFADQIAGNGNYTAYLTVQKLGAGSAYEGGARTTVAVPSGVTAQMFPTIPLSVKETDVVKVYLLGLAGDTTTPDIATEVWDADPLTQFQGVAQAGGANTITLAAAGSPATDDLVKGAVIRTRGGTGVGQSRAILSYVASTKVATVGRNWVVNPDSTSVYEIIGLSVPRVDDSLQVYPLNSAGVTTILADYARRTGDYATVSALTALQGDATTLLSRIVGNILTGNHNPQSGDTYAQIGAAGAGLTALGDTRIANLDATVSSRTKPADTQAAVTLVATTTNLTNAPTVGDFTATMKTSLNAATPNVTVSDKTGFALSAAGVQAIWDALTSALTTVGSIGKRLVDDLTGDIYARLGAPAGASVSADIASVKTDTGTTIPNRLPAALVGGRMDSNLQAAANGVITAAVIATDAIDADALAANAVTEIQSGLYTGTPPTVSAIADAVWDELLSAHVIAGSASAALTDASLAGTGAILTTFTVNDSLGQPLDGVLVEISTDALKANVIASGYTLTNGIVRLNLDPGTYYLWKNLAGYDFTNPQTIVVSA